MLELVDKDFTKIIISLLWGLAISTLLYNNCNGKKCTYIKYIGPDPSLINNNIYNYGSDKCYVYKPYIVEC